MKRQEDLLKKYYKGETSLEEERMLKDKCISNKSASVEKDVFNYYKNEAYVPEDLEENIIQKIDEKQKTGKTVKMRLYRISSAAAAILIILSIYLGYRKDKNEKMENEFFQMEQALYQVSETLQPDEQQDMMVLWVDNDVEIIIN